MSNSSIQSVKILSIKDEIENVKTFWLERPENFIYTPGQYVWLSLPDTEKSPMAIASGINEDNLMFSVRKWGEFTEKMFSLKPGDEIIMDGPHGTSFPVSRLNGAPLYLVAGGTGITPIRSLLHSIDNEIEKHLFYGAKTPKEILFSNKLTLWPTMLTLTVDYAEQPWTGNVGLVTELLSLSNIDSSGFAFVCGPSPMIKAVASELLSLGFNKGRIFVSLERFDNDGNVIGPVLPLNNPIVGF